MISMLRAREYFTTVDPTPQLVHSRPIKIYVLVFNPMAYCIVFCSWMLARHPESWKRVHALTFKASFFLANAKLHVI